MNVVRRFIGARGPGRTPLERRCEERLRELALPARRKMTIEEVCEHVGARRGRPLLVLPTALPTGSPHGLWVATDRNDYVFLEERLAPIHQHQVVLHEIGHLVCDHDTSPVLAAEVSRLLLPSLDPGLVRRVLGRGHTDSEAEIEAELVGSLIGRRLSSWTVCRDRPVPPEAHELVARLAVLGPPGHPGTED